MAKSKKTDSTSSAATPPKATARKEAKPAKSVSSFGIDTDLVAQAAAMVVGNKAMMHESQGESPADAERKETATFKHLKETLAKPGGAALNQFLHNTTSPAAKKSNLPFGGGKQVGHNQTFGGDVTRSGVPRRTPG